MTFKNRVFTALLGTALVATFGVIADAVRDKVL